jgi:hypothetical protein
MEHRKEIQGETKQLLLCFGSRNWKKDLSMADPQVGLMLNAE